MDLLIETFRNAISGLHKTLRKSFTDNASFSLTEIQTISLIYRNKHIFPSELAAKTRITMPSMSQILKKLETQGFIYRTASKDDRRKVFVSLTSLGAEIVQKARSSKDETLKQLIVTKLTAEEIEVLKQAIPVLQKLNSI